MQENSQPNYISLKEAAKYSGCYSQDYLSLRARQGKLKAVKIARNWVTKKEWIDEYLERMENYKKREAGKKEKETAGHKFSTTSQPTSKKWFVVIFAVMVVCVLTFLLSVFFLW